MTSLLDKAMIIAAALTLAAALCHCQPLRQLDDLGDREAMRRDRELEAFYFPNPCPPEKENL